MKSFIRKKYNNLQTKYPNANYVFQEFKKNNFFYFTKHKVSSALYFLRLIKADKKLKSYR